MDIMENKKSKSFGQAIIFALKNTYTIGISWIPIALAFGLIVRESGIPFYWAGISGVICPFGSLQMLVFSFVMSNATWGVVLVTAAALSFRHLFYGLSFLERFRKFSASKYYMIYMLCDELYSVYCSMSVPPYMNEKQVHIATAFVLQAYWVILSTLFALIGAVIPFDLAGVDFALTALFAVILIEMILSGNTKIPVVCAAVCGIGCLLVFGADNFLIPALLIVSTVLILLRKYIERPRKEMTSGE